jgi:hypothetical protein
MTEISEALNDLAAVRQKLFTTLVSLGTEDLLGAEANGFEGNLRRALWHCVRELDPLLPAAPDVDLTLGDATTQQVLYGYVLREYLSPHLLEDPGDVFIPDYDADQAHLRVFFEHGRWFVTWIKLEEPADRPEALRRELLVFEKGDDGALRFREV